MSVNTYNSTTGVLTRVAGNGGGSFIYPHINITAETGSTVTITDGTATITAIETSEGLFEADVIDLKTYTITATLNGETLTQTLDVDTVKKYSVDMGSTIPEGSTVTPTDDIQIWLACAEIDKSYTTLAEVLADTDTYQLLLSNSNACDYMARSTSWAAAEGAVPTLATASSNVISSGDYSGQPAWKVFDGDNSTPWSADASYLSGGAYVGYKFDTAKNINSLGYVKRYESASSTQVWKVQASNDGTDWTDLSDNFTVLTAGDNDKSWHYINFTNTNSYSYYRVYEVSNNNNSLNPSFMELQFYEADITRNLDAMALIGKYDYACNKLLSNATWASAIANSSYFEYVLDVKVPTMTSNTTPSGECSASSNFNQTNYPTWKAFDNNTSTQWLTTTVNASTVSYIQYKFSEARIINTVKMIFENWSSGSMATISNISIKGSNDGDNFTPLHSYQPDNDINQLAIFDNNDSYLYYRVEITGYNAINTQAGIPSNVSITELQFYGRHASNYREGKVAIHGARNATLYYKDSGSDITIGQTDSTTGIASVTLANIPTGTYAIYDGVAKDPSDLTADYSKTVTITDNTTEVYLMPDGALYWWGYESSDLDNPSQWPGQTANVACTKYTNYYDATPGSTSYASIGQKGITSALSKAHAVVDTISGTSAYDVSLFFTTASTPPSFVYVSSLALGLKTLSLDYSNTVTTPYCISVGAQKNCSAKIHALWYEE